MLKAATTQTGSSPGIFRRSRRKGWLGASRASGGREAMGAAFALALGCVLASGCGEEEPHYLPPLPDLGSGPAATQGLPCEVSKLLATHCLACHGQPPAAAPIALVSYADLTAKSVVDSTKTVAERALLRMLDNMAPMPPGPSATVGQSELAPMQMWVAAGAKMVSCQAK